MADDDSPPAWWRYDDLIEDDELPTMGFRAVAYLRPDGTPDMAFTYDLNGKAIAFQLIGLLEGAKLELWKQIQQDQDED